jgi:hypothetical protein
MFFTGATVPGDPAVPNEDWTAATPDLIVVADGATVRTETGCTHGAAWYTRKLGAAVIAGAASRRTSLPAVLTNAIKEVAALHPGCDLQHPGTPSAGIAIVRIEGDTLRWLVLGDVTVVLDTATGMEVVSDQRVSATASEERRDADRYPIGSPQKATALLAMKHVELASRNRPDGYWIAAADPAAVDHAITGEMPLASVRQLAVLTDGAARYVDLFAAGEWAGVLKLLVSSGPQWFINELVRGIESHDPRGVRYPRNKVSDDATIVFAQPVPEVDTRDWSAPKSQAQLDAESELLWRLDNPNNYGDGMRQKVEAERRAEEGAHG